MKNKIIVGLALFGLIGTIAYLGYTKYTEITKSIANPLQAIPTNAAIIVKSDNWLKGSTDLEPSIICNQFTKNKKGKQIKNKITTTKKTIEQSEN